MPIQVAADTITMETDGSQANELKRHVACSFNGQQYPGTPCWGKAGTSMDCICFCARRLIIVLDQQSCRLCLFIVKLESY